MPDDLTPGVHLTPAVVDVRGVGLNADVHDEQKVNHAVDDEEDQAGGGVDSRRQKTELERRDDRHEHQQYRGDQVPLPGELAVRFDDPGAVHPLGQRQLASFDHLERVPVLVPRRSRRPRALALIVQLPVVERAVAIAVVPFVALLLLAKADRLRLVYLLRVSRHGVFGARDLHVRESLGEGPSVAGLLDLRVLLLGLQHGLRADVVPV